MALSTVIVFEDGREQVVGEEHDDLAEAVEHALELADRFGSHRGDGEGPPKWVSVTRNGAIMLTLSVLRGGLSRPASR